MCWFCPCFTSNREPDSPTNSIKTIVYKRATGFRKSNCANETCTICCDDFVNNEEIQLTPCHHGYHKECLANWMNVKTNCPMCQHRLKYDQFDEHTPLLRSYRIDV